MNQTVEDIVIIEALSLYGTCILAELRSGVAGLLKYAVPTRLRRSRSPDPDPEPFVEVAYVHTDGARTRRRVVNDEHRIIGAMDIVNDAIEGLYDMFKRYYNHEFESLQSWFIDYHVYESKKDYSHLLSFIMYMLPRLSVVHPYTEPMEQYDLLAVSTICSACSVNKLLLLSEMKMSEILHSAVVEQLSLSDGYHVVIPMTHSPDANPQICRHTVYIEQIGVIVRMISSMSHYGDSVRADAQQWLNRMRVALNKCIESSQTIFNRIDELLSENIGHLQLEALLAVTKICNNSYRELYDGNFQFRDNRFRH